MTIREAMRLAYLANDRPRAKKINAQLRRSGVTDVLAEWRRALQAADQKRLSRLVNLFGPFNPFDPGGWP